MTLHIDVLCGDSSGSSLGVCESTIWGDRFRVGVGGSELALLTMCRLWHDEGHKVVLYNNPWSINGVGGTSEFEQRPIHAFSPGDNRDILIIFRTPNPKAVPAKGKKIWWSCDQYTVGDYRHFSSFVDKIVCISPFHARYFEEVYGITNTIVIDLPVRLQDLDKYKVNRIEKRMIFTSVPDRGLQNLWRMYPKIKKYIPELSIAITSDYRLWGASELNDKHRGKWVVYDDVDFLGALPRERYLEELSKADILLYPGSYDELFCISIAEAQCAGVIPITSAKGALATTNFGHIFYLDATDPRNDVAFIDRVNEILFNRREMEVSREIITAVARERFSPDTIKKHWNRLVFEENKE